MTTRLTRDLTGGDAFGRATIWTYRSSAMYGPTEEDARTAILSEAYRAVPREAASATILSIRQTPTGRWSAMVKRVRIDPELAELRARLAPGALDWMPTIERSIERRAIRARIAELEDEA